LRVLVVLPFPPDHEGGAAARCAVALLQGLESHGVDWRALAVAAQPPSPESPPLSTPSSAPPLPASADGRVELVAVERSRWRGRWGRLAHPGGGLSGGRFGERLRALAADVDVVHLVEVSTASALSMLERPALLQLHSLTHRDRDAWRPWVREDRDALETLRAERRALRRADWVLLNSAEIAADMPRRIAPSHRVVAPLALDPAHYAEQATLEQPVVGLIGTAGWPPTANAVRRLLTRVWPLVRERRPDATLMLAGAGMQAEAFGAPAGLPGVQWRGRVPSASDFLRELAVLLYPLSAGGGVKVKVLEALALGVPVVSTAEGAEGLLDHRGVVVEEDDQRNFLANHTPAPAALPVVDLYGRMIRDSSG
jgi:glycosyltransferase involved in cell wall biosynthesis